MISCQLYSSRKKDFPFINLHSIRFFLFPLPLLPPLLTSCLCTTCIDPSHPCLVLRPSSPPYYDCHPGYQPQGVSGNYELLCGQDCSLRAHTLTLFGALAHCSQHLPHELLYRRSAYRSPIRCGSIRLMEMNTNRAT